MRLTGVILDWAGTLVDLGSNAPVAALRGVFASAGVPITAHEARGPMGLAKRAHVQRLLDLPRVVKEWTRIQGRAPRPEDVDEIYRAFVPRQLALLKDHSNLIPGVPEATERMRSQGLRIGTTTGYNRPMLEYLLERAREQGFVPDYATCPDDVPSGRPHPFMCYLNAIHMGISPMWTMVKIGDTPADIEEGLNAGMWTIGVTRTGNEVGLTEAEWGARAREQQTRLLANAHETLCDAGAHYIAESAAECDEILNRIQARLEAGGRP
jgi:phosphonoacetaldehyde hydrolase